MVNGLIDFIAERRKDGFSDSVLYVLGSSDSKEEILELLEFDRAQLTKVIGLLEAYELLTDSEILERILLQYKVKTPAELYDGILTVWKNGHKAVAKARFNMLPSVFQKTFIENYADGKLSYFLLTKL